MSSKAKQNKISALRVSSEVAREIRQHARSESKTEVCGVLIGTESEGLTTVEACIAGVNAAQGGAHVTFTQDTWEHIYKIKDRDYPDERIVGWYHSHPGFGVFLSDHDTFIHKNFFSSPQQVAWVYDPHSDEEGCFGWKGERLERLSSFGFVDVRGGEVAGGADKPRSTLADDEEGHQPEKRERRENSRNENTDLTRLANIVSTVFSHLLIFIMGAAIVWFLFPHIALVPVPVDPLTGKPLRDVPGFPSTGGEANPSSSAAPQDKNQPNPADSTKPSKSDDAKRTDGHP